MILVRLLQYANALSGIRDKYLADLGIKILRYSNYDINNNFVAVCEDIDAKIKERI